MPQSIEPGICVTVTGRTPEELLRARVAAEAVADVVELRLDSMARPDPVCALEGRRRPVIVTCRPVWEGGAFEGSEDERRRILETAAASGAEFIDVEAAAIFASDIVRRRAGRGVIVSKHLFGVRAADIDGEYAALRATGAEVAKLAVEVSSLSETLPLFQLANATRGSAGGHVLIGMGDSGTATRVLASRLRNRWTYAGAGIAPGQMPASCLLHDFRFRRIRPDAAIYGIVGKPISRSRSPVMHNAGFAASGVNAVYVALETGDAEDFVRFARTSSVRGASITAPLKIAMLDHVDDVEPLARRVGAINTLVVRGERWIGANTDVEGFLTPLSKRLHLKGVRASVLGAGGAARAVAVGLADQGAIVSVSARRSDQAAPLAELAGGYVEAYPPAPGSWDVLVNATPVGSAVDPSNPMEGVPLDGRVVYDLVYSPADTRLLAAAPACSAATNSGISRGSAEPSASSITMMSPVAAANPQARALPLPRRV
jgi:3-dehydroquinate dehydratase/shikimate dehydrogenase